MTDLPPKSPRFKKLKVKSRKQQKIVQQNLSDGSRISEGVPETIKLAFASAIMAFSEMEMSAEHFIWDVLGLLVDDGKLVTRIDTNEKFILAKKLSVRYSLPLHPNAQTTADAWTAIQSTIEARNKMAHGVWRMIDGSTPIVISYRIPVEPGDINSESFPLDRIEAVTSMCLKVKKLFDAMSRNISDHGRPGAPTQAQTPNDPQFPIGGDHVQR
jgi:hypothetical protein